MLLFNSFFLLIIEYVQCSVHSMGIQEISEKLDDLTRTVEELKHENVEMRQRNSQLRQENIEMRGRLRNIEMSACRKENNCSVQTKDIRPKHAKKRLLSPSAPESQATLVAFTAVLTNDFPVGPHQTIEYDKVLTNIGNAYDVRHGHFTVPVHGIYLMSASTNSIGDSAVRTEIVRNGVQLAAMYGDDYDNASHTIVVELELNDMVWVRHFDNNLATVHSAQDRYYSTFSGVLLNTL